MAESPRGETHEDDGQNVHRHVSASGLVDAQDAPPSENAAVATLGSRTLDVADVSVSVEGSGMGMDGRAPTRHMMRGCMKNSTPCHQCISPRRGIQQRLLREKHHERHDDFDDINHTQS